MVNPIGPVTQGGVYGRSPDAGGHRCGKCSNPYTLSGGNDACPNNRASQVVTYIEGSADAQV